MGDFTGRRFFIILALSLALCTLGAIVAQPSEEWEKTFGGSKDDRGFSVQQTSDGGYIVAGERNRYDDSKKDTTSSDIWLVKMSPNGTEEWNQIFSVSNDERGESVQQTSDGGYVIAGWTERTKDYHDVWLIKTSPNGTEEWRQFFGGSKNDYGRSVQQTSDGGYIVAGYTYSFGAGSYDAWLIKTNSHGSKEWDRTLGGSSSDYGLSVQQTSDGGYIVAGYTYSFGAGGSDAWLIKTDSAGNEVWNKTFGGSDANDAYDVKETSDGGYILAGGTASHDAGGHDLWLIKVAPVSGATLPKAAKTTVAPKVAPEPEDETSAAPSGATGRDASNEITGPEGSESSSAPDDASRPGSGGPLPEVVIEQTSPEDYVYSHEISVEGKVHTVYDVFWNGDCIPRTDNDYKFSLVYDPAADEIVTEEDLVEKCLLVEAFYIVAPQDQNVWTQKSEVYATVAQDFADVSDEAADNLAKISVLTLVYDGYKTFVFGDVGSAFSITNLILDSAKNWADPSIVAGPRLQKYLEIDTEQKMTVFALEIVEAAVGMASEEVSENPELEESLSSSLKIGGDVKASYTDLITSITDEITEPCKNMVRYVELRRTLYLGYLAMLSSEVSSSSDAFSRSEYSYEDVVLYLAADEDIPALSAEMWGFVRDGIVEAQSHFGTAWMIDEDAVSKIDAEIDSWKDLERRSSGYVSGILRTRDFMAARYYENVLNDDFRIRSWPILEISGVGSDSVRIKNVGAATAEDIRLYNNGREPMLAPKGEIRPGEEITVNLRSDTEHIIVRFSSKRVGIVDYLFVP